MRPNTLHYVLTTSHSMTYGRHFYSSSTIQDTIRGIVEVFFFEDILTNTSHRLLRTSLHRMLLMWLDIYERNDCKLITTQIDVF
jgi:phage terminase large subunit